MASGEIGLSGTTMRRMPVLAQSQDAAQSQDPTQSTPPLGQDPAFASASPDEISEIDVTAQAISSQTPSPQLTPQNFQVVLDTSGYFHIFARHVWWPIGNTSRYAQQFRNVPAINGIFAATVNSTIGFPQPNGNYYFSANLGFTVGTDQLGGPTTWNTVIVQVAVMPTATTPGVGTVVTMYPGQ